MKTDRIRQIAQIGGDGNLDALGAERVPDRVGRVVRDGEAGHIDVADTEAGPGLEGFKDRFAIAPRNRGAVRCEM